MPARLLRDGINSSDRVNALDHGSEVFYRRLMSEVDDHGTFDARPAYLRPKLYPLRIDKVTEAHVTYWLANCEKFGLVALYSVDGKPYGKMLDTRWQTRSKPKHPLPTDEQLQASVNRRSQPQTPVYLDVVVDVVVDVGVGVVVDSVPSLRSGTGAFAPKSPGETIADADKAKAETWAKAKDVLVEQGMGRKNTGAFIGMLIKNHGEEQVLAALRQTAAAPPADMKAYLIGVLKPKPESRTAARLRVAEESRRLKDGQREEAPAERDISGESQRVA